MENLEFRKLHADEIECRAQIIRNTGVSLLLYKNARCDMAILDETVGPLNWQREHTRDNANCIVSIWDNSKMQWIKKEDTGTESNTEKEKGLASDSFKRACTNWGIGRELYTAPFIWVKSIDTVIKDETGAEVNAHNAGKGKLRCYDSFFVGEIKYNDKGAISSISIFSKNTGNMVYRWKETSGSVWEG